MCSKIKTIYEPIDEESLNEINQNRWKEDKVDELKNGFTNAPKGRFGSIYYKQDELVVEIEWEMSGDPAYQIIILSDGFEKSIRPNKKEIPLEKKEEIKKLLDEWLKKQNAKYIIY